MYEVVIVGIKKVTDIRVTDHVFLHLRIQICIEVPRFVYKRKYNNIIAKRQQMYIVIWTYKRVKTRVCNPKKLRKFRNSLFAPAYEEEYNKGADGKIRCRKNGTGRQPCRIRQNLHWRHH